MELDRGFISALLKQNNLNLVKQYKVKASVLDPQYRRLFKSILKHFEEYGVMPQGSTLEHYDDRFDPLPARRLEPFEFYCDKLLERATYNLMRKVIEEGAEKLPTDVKSVVDNMRKALSKVNTDLKPSSDIEVSEGIALRMDAYERAEAGLAMGMPFPWETLNEASMGMQAEDLISVVADSGVGKSWFLIITAAYLYKLGYHILFFTREMSAEQILKRFDAVHGEFAYDKLRRGQLGTKGKKEYYEYLEGLKDNTNVFYVSGDDNFEEKIGLDLVDAKIDEYMALLPDPEKLLVIVDGAYFLAPEENADDGMDWKVIAKVTQGLKRMARRKKVPMLISSQAKRGTKKKDNPDAADVGFGYSIVQDSNVLILMNQTEQDRNEKTMRFWTAKIRDSATVSWNANWDFDLMDFSEFGRGHGIDTGSYQGGEDGEEHPDSDYMEVRSRSEEAGAYASTYTTERVLKPGARGRRSQAQTKASKRRAMVAQMYGEDEE